MICLNEFRTYMRRTKYPMPVVLVSRVDITNKGINRDVLGRRTYPQYQPPRQYQRDRGQGRGNPICNSFRLHIKFRVVHSIFDRGKNTKGIGCFFQTAFGVLNEDFFLFLKVFDILCDGLLC
ncbi:hypothetical protein KUTeg_004156 [Tegillarca granosa]|uniref:Uncharacterized protein n=1 Tax=Tegillarca granosa TaxID=220873 RepID=A0ABQ9FTN1_TEGGR|nr:hypothetical protein KUTeg_004156 [Tegillarca granosa]